MSLRLVCNYQASNSGSVSGRHTGGIKAMKMHSFAQTVDETRESMHNCDSQWTLLTF